jgi:hypothetical protein
MHSTVFGPWLPHPEGGRQFAVGFPLLARSHRVPMASGARFSRSFLRLDVWKLPFLERTAQLFDRVKEGRTAATRFSNSEWAKSVGSVAALWSVL